MFKKMTSLFMGMGSFFTFDPKKYTMDEFFGDIKTFTEHFKVRVLGSCIGVGVRMSTPTLVDVCQLSSRRPCF